MADEEAEQDGNGGGGGPVLSVPRLTERLRALESRLRESGEPAVAAATEYCQQLCQVRRGLVALLPPVGACPPRG
ncbi:hypothetical protein JD844_024151 [Phrynosoma platyrhinos]|uniref:Uncharacterized protein n=1 Tax=Phrynosoma platyrhinos TaxID=52577 RepID=A0ABQ7SY01_PHRPL|nr:hypothetical protein JD844_024151 [Phrynosoma platyrhinos]